MAVQLSVTARNAGLDSFETALGAQPVLKIRTGAKPANCATADAGTVLATMLLPSDWMLAAASGAKAKSGTWEDGSADESGTAGHFRIYANDGTTCHMQGTVTATGGGGDMTTSVNGVASAAFLRGQTFQITAFALTAGNS